MRSDPPLANTLPVLLLILFLGGCAAVGKVDEPPFDVIRQSRDFELRAYGEMIVAETWVEGTLSEASNAGFRILAGYIFGDNRTRTSAGSETIAMTAPVTVEPEAEKIPMTAPVTVERASSQAATAGHPSSVPSEPATVAPTSADRWRIHFVMPAQYTLETLPVPNDPRVQLRQVGGQRMAVIRFSGLAREERVAAKTSQLLDWVQGEGLRPTGTPQLARYNPPWTLPFLRRNEVMVPVE